MPRNQFKDYLYIPNFILNAKQKMPSYESFRARLETGGTFFRSKEIGTQANKISLEVTSSGQNFTLTVTAPTKVSEVVFSGSATKYGFNIVAPESATPQDFTFTFISEKKFSVVGSVSGNAGEFSIGSAVRVGGIAVTVSEGSLPFSAGDWFSFSVLKPREVYTASQDGSIDPLTGLLIGTSAIPAIRAAVNASSSLIEMPERGFDYVDQVGTDSDSGRTVGRSGPLLEPETLLSVFPSTPLYGGNGPPSNPSGIQTGPERTLIHLNRTETDSGTLTRIGRCLEFIGSSIYNGFFQNY